MLPVLLVVFELAWLVGMGVYLVLQRRSSTATLAWLLALAFLPFVGLPVYYFFGPRRLQRRRRRRALARETVAPARGERGVGFPEPAVPERWRSLVPLIQETCGCPLTAAAEPVLYLDGDACFEAMEAAIRDARHHVHQEVYIFEPDRTGRRFCDLLAAKARQGVEVRLLVDAIGGKRIGRRFREDFERAGVEFAWFNPLRLRRFRPRLLNFRSHRKILVVDGRTAFVGGMNVCDDHARGVRGDRAWRDTHLGFAGPAVREAQFVFLEDWAFATGDAPLSETYLKCDGVPGGIPAQVVSSGPDQDHHAIHRMLFAAVGAARERIWATSPYLVPDEPMLTALTTAALRGIDVRILVPRQGDLRVAAAAGRSYYDELTGAGVRLFEYGPPMVHAKTLVLDEDLAVVGTANLDNRSFRLNFEIAVVLYGGAVPGLLAEAFAADLARAQEVIGRRVSEVPFPKRLGEAVARLFAPIL